MDFQSGPPPVDGNRNMDRVLIGVNWAIFGPSWIAVILRTITRIWISRNFGWDDALMLVTQALNSAGMGFVMLEVYWGLGQHKYYIKPDHWVGFLKYNYLDWCQVFITLALCKIAICLFLLRISKFDRWRKFLYGMIAFLVVSHLAITLLFIFQCNPVNKAWSIHVPGTCWSKYHLEILIIVQGVLSIVTDIIGALFPILLIRNMKLPKRQRLALNLLMGLGFLTATVCVIRTAFSYQVKADDQTWQGVPNAICRMLEINFGIIAACAPMIRPMWNLGRRKYREKWGPGSKTSVRTPMSRLQWYRPPVSGPWYRKWGRRFYWGLPRPPVSQTSSTKSMNPNGRHSGAEENEKAILPAPNPVVMPRQHVPESKWPQRYEIERPANATWAKDDVEAGPKTPKTSSSQGQSQSFDLPLQGVRSDDWNSQYGSAGGVGEGGEFDDDEEPPEWGGYQFHRAVV